MFRHDQARTGASPQVRTTLPGLAWTFVTGGDIFSSPAIDAEGTIYVGSLDGRLYAIDTKGQLKWSFQTMGAIWSSPAIGRDGTVYVASIDTNVYAIRDGQLLWAVKLGNC